MLTTLNHALKEWEVAVNALEKGESILLLRKGGIREDKGHFEVDYNPVLLYPTYEHQKPHLLKSQYASLVNPVPSGWHPQTISISIWAEITHVFQLRNISIIKQLLPYHIWKNNVIEERFKWKPSQPLFILLLRVFSLPQSLLISYRSNYGGCRSWIQLDSDISLLGSQPVITDNNYYQILEAIQEIIISA
jgi:hypothetical protein